MLEQLQQITKLFYTCNLPFLIADHPECSDNQLKLLRDLASGFPGTVKDIGGPLLDKTNETLISSYRAKKLWSCKMASNGIHNTPVIATSLHCLSIICILNILKLTSNYISPPLKHKEPLKISNWPLWLVLTSIDHFGEYWPGRF